MRFLKAENGFIVENKISAFYCADDHGVMALFARLIDGTTQRLAVYDGVLSDTVSPEKKQSLILHYLMKNTVDSGKAFAEAKAHAEKAHSIGEGQAKSRRENSRKNSSQDWEENIAERRKRNRDMFFKHRKSEEKAKEEPRVNLFRFTPDLDDEEDREPSRSHEKEIEDVKMLFKMLSSALDTEKGRYRHAL